MNVSCGRCGTVVAVADNAPAGVVIRCPGCQAPIDVHSARTSPHTPGGSVAPAGGGSRIGQTLGGFQLEREIGRGGMGVVYRARQLSLGRTVAVKVLPEDLTASDELTARFVREAGAMAVLNHPNIVAVYDKGLENGTYYFAMELVEGQSLRDLLRHRRPSPEDAVAILGPVLEALAHAHARGIVHRDLKPENIMLDHGGRPKVMDFGIAHLFGTAESPSITRTRAFMGTLHYMAPEQAGAAGTVDGRADIYATGVILYELLTGNVPLGAFRPPSQVVPGLDPAFDHIVVQALQTSPQDRYASADEMLADLAATPAGQAARIGGRIPTPRPATTPRPGGPRAPGTDLRTIAAPTLPTSLPAEAPAARGSGVGVAVVVILLLLGLAAVVVGGGFFVLWQLADDGKGSSGHTRTPTTGPRPTVPPTRGTAPPTRVAPPSVGGVTVSGWNATVKGMRFFEGPDENVPLEQRAYRTRFPRHSSRYVWWELELEYAAPGRRVDFDVTWQIKLPSGRVHADQKNSYYLDAEGGSTYYAAGWGGAVPASWWPGTHEVQLYADGKPIASGRFEMYREELQGDRNRRKVLVPKVKVGGVETDVTELLFYESGPGTLELEKRIYATSFAAADARYVNWHLELLYPPIKEKKPFHMRWRLGDSEGKEITTIEQDYFLDPAATATFYHAGWGSEQRGSWQPGIYTLDGYMGDLKVVTANFAVD